MENIKFKYNDETGNEKYYWIDKTEWDFLNAFRHNREAMLGYFGSRLLELPDTPITSEERENFNKFYSEKYPEYAKLLKL